MSNNDTKRDFRGVEKGANLLGKVRIVDADGVEVTEGVRRSVKASVVQWFSNVIGIFTLVDSKGESLTEDGALVTKISGELPAGTRSIGAVAPSNRVVSCPEIPMEIPGITAGDALDAGDCIGTIMKIAVPKSGEIRSATYLDLDDEGTQLDLEIFKQSITQIASDAAWAPSDTDMLSFITELAFVAGDDHINSYTFELNNIGKAYTAPEGYIWIQSVDRSTKTIAAGAMPRIQIQIIPDDPDWKA